MFILHKLFQKIEEQEKTFQLILGSLNNPVIKPNRGMKGKENYRQSKFKVRHHDISYLNTLVCVS